MIDVGAPIRSLRRGAVALLAAAAAYEAVARSGIFPPALFPTIPTIFTTLADMLADGSMLLHAAYTLFRVLVVFAGALVIGIPLGVLMARFVRVERFFMPLVTALMPIP